MITHLGAYPSLGRLLDSHKHEIGKILMESMEHEAAALALYKELLSSRNRRRRGGVSCGLRQKARSLAKEF